MTSATKVDIQELALAAEAAVLEIWGSDAQISSANRLENDTQARTPLDRLAQIGVALAEHQQYELLDIVIVALKRLFGAAGAQRSVTLIAQPIAEDAQALRWFEIATRIYVIGAVSVDRESFGAIRPLILQQPNQKRVGRFWLRETVTALARLNRFKGQSLIGPISEFVSDHPVFARRFKANKDDIVRSLCQFDLLQCVVSVAETRDLTACYPNFGAFFKERTEPIISDLIAGGKSRLAVPNVPDTELARIISDLDELANRQFFSFAGWHRGHWDDDRIPAFLAKNDPKRSG